MLRVGHRGAPREVPGNTMSSFRAAHRLGCDWVECDCRRSADGIVVLAHDPVVTGLTGRHFQVEQESASTLRALDLGSGEGVPSLAELVEWAAGRVGVMADVKVGGMEQEIGDALTLSTASTRSTTSTPPALPLDQILVPGADAAGRRRFRELFPDLPLSTTVDRGALAEVDTILTRIDTEAVTLEHPLLTSERVSRLHSRGIRVFAWTVDELFTMQELAGMGIDGIISNRADLLATLTGW